MKRIFRMAFLGIAMVAFLLSSCAPKPTPVVTQPPTAVVQPPPTEPPTAKPVEKTTVTLWLQSDDLGNLVVENIVKPFNEQSTTVNVEVTLQANRWDAIRTALAGGTGPDLVGTPGPSLAVQLARAGYLLPLDDLAQKYGWGDTFVPWALDLGKVDGKLYSTPMEVETLVLFYNKTLFEAHGWQPPKTMDELFTLCDQIKAAGLVPFAHANAEYRGADEWYVTEFLNHVAGPEKIYGALTGLNKWDDPAIVEAIDKLNEVQQNGWFMGSLDKYYTLTFAERDDALASGKAAMNIEGTWFLGTALAKFGAANGNANDWDWAPVPSTSGDTIFDLGIGGSMSINKNAANPDAAAEFMTYYYSPEVQASLLRAGYNAAPIKFDTSVLTGIDPRYAQIIAALSQASQAGNYGYTSWTFWPPKSEAYLADVEKVWSGELTSTAFLQGLQAQFDEEKAAGELLPVPAR
jgi:raffinose/stachyose/melibiose transport system substrate-binding protein